jgi:glycogen operon protein
MLLGGDELGRSQGGNNNAYCQDNEISWYAWDDIDWERVGFVQTLTRLRASHPVLRANRWWTDVTWYRPDGGEKSAADWEVSYAHTLAMFLDGSELADASFLAFFNSRPAPQVFVVPESIRDRHWEVVIDSGRSGRSVTDQIEVEPFALVLARSTSGSQIA